MRMAALVTLSILVAGCSHTGGGQSAAAPDNREFCDGEHGLAGEQTTGAVGRTGGRRSDL